MKAIDRFFIVLFVCVMCLGVISIAEEITLTTYYPAPYGVYEELTVTGNVGIGTASPISKSHIHESSGGAVVQTFTNSDTGAATGNGLFIGVISNEDAYIWNAENTNMVFATNSQPRMIIANNGIITTTGNVGIGTTNPGSYALNVVGDINTSGDVRKNGTPYVNPDYVFETGYELMSLAGLKNYVVENRHLPGMPSTEEIKIEGVKIFEQNRLILEKLEEAYLYIFELQGRIEKLEEDAARTNFKTEQ